MCGFSANLAVTNWEVQMNYENPALAFEKAIAAGLLSRDETSSIYAGLYMYMGHVNGVPTFKNTITRRYL